MTRSVSATFVVEDAAQRSFFPRQDLLASAVKVVLGPQKPRNPKLQAKPNIHNRIWLSV